jgi:hypothetical protein
MISGTELATQFPNTAVNVLMKTWREGGDYLNAWDVLVSAWGELHAIKLATEAAGEDAKTLFTDLFSVSE